MRVRYPKAASVGIGASVGLAWQYWPYWRRVPHRIATLWRLVRGHVGPEADSIDDCSQLAPGGAPVDGPFHHHVVLAGKVRAALW